jgi:alpha 1,2-mannosyltransferase
MGYNLCHYWSNFEIIDLSFTRSPAYTSYFSTLDKAGGFFYERWGDAPVRSIAASMILNSSEVWHMDYAGYFHPPISQCPRTLDPGQVCACDSHDNVDYSPPFVSCRARADKIRGLDTKAIVHEINLEHGVVENFKPDEMPYIIPPPRLRTQPIM